MKKILFSVVVVAMLWSCGKDDGPSTPPVSAKPTITDFNPKTGPVGTEVTITGTNFSTTKADNLVKVRNTVATVSSASATQLKVTVPAGAQTGKITVAVDGETATSTADFVVTALVPENSAPEMADQEFKPLESITDADEIGQVTATDPDGDTLTFSITDSELFVISDAGMLTLAEGKTLDFETETTHNITVSVTDGEKSIGATITVSVQDVAEADPNDKAAFVTTWETTAPEETIYIGANVAYEYDFTINWGDGTVENINTVPESNVFEHTYTDAGTYTVSIIGEFPAINGGSVFELFLANSELLKLVGLEQWGAIEWKSLNNAFHWCANMVYHATDVPDLSKVTGIKSMFHGATSFDGDISGWNTSNVTDMRYVFRQAIAFKGDISNWNTSKVIYMNDMFRNATSFNGDISGWNTASVISMGGMFRDADSFNQDLGSWDIGNVQNMSTMFDGSGMSKENFNATIIGWHAFVDANNGPLGVTLGTEGLTLCGLTAFEAATDLGASYQWTLEGAINVEEQCN
ncbi:BspA family leucine-rich repeat surface protein [Flagellimonas crocea]|uniref:BspA family leucine-rich repeat surface protein n=1 Tax=Flagellimonas crocea TaxID=3067311 RepID=UPI00296F9A50|nr:BspA family leucine-rich repeat surface protein [Muricauda sp. DH64]